MDVAVVVRLDRNAVVANVNVTVLDQAIDTRVGVYPIYTANLTRSEHRHALNCHVFGIGRMDSPAGSILRSKVGDCHPCTVEEFNELGA
jgi:hypothetical protein